MTRSRNRAARRSRHKSSWPRSVPLGVASPGPSSSCPYHRRGASDQALLAVSGKAAIPTTRGTHPRALTASQPTPKASMNRPSFAGFSRAPTRVCDECETISDVSMRPMRPAAPATINLAIALLLDPIHLEAVGDSRSAFMSDLKKFKSAPSVRIASAPPYMDPA
jgi:hypothetical protein